MFGASDEVENVGASRVLFEHEEAVCARVGVVVSLAGCPYYIFISGNYDRCGDLQTSTAKEGFMLDRMDCEGTESQRANSPSPYNFLRHDARHSRFDKKLKETMQVSDPKCVASIHRARLDSD